MKIRADTNRRAIKCKEKITASTVLAWVGGGPTVVGVSVPKLRNIVYMVWKVRKNRRDGARGGGYYRGFKLCSYFHHSLVLTMENGVI